MIGEFIGDGKKYPAVGVSFGLDVIFEILKERMTKLSNIDVYIIPMNNNITALKIANELRQNNIKVEIEMNNLKVKKALSIANEIKSPIVIMLGENELKENKIIIKDMRNNFQITEDIKNFINTIQELTTIGKIEYKVLNPGGNKTALVKGINYTDKQKRLINKLIMEKYLDVEQVGFLSNEKNRLEMAGGEFCVNATRCAVYEYLKGEKGELEISVSGAEKMLKGKVIDNDKVEVTMKIEKDLKDLIEMKNDFTCVKIDGILTAVSNEEKSEKYIEKLKENEELTKIELKEIMKKELNSKEKAEGIMLLEKENGNIRINPIVWVKEIDTVFYETACGSGSLGTAIYEVLNNKSTSSKLIQPSNYTIEIDLDVKDNYIKNAKICGVVKEESYAD